MLQERIDLIYEILSKKENYERKHNLDSGVDLTPEEEKLRMYLKLLNNDMNSLDVLYDENIKHDAVSKTTLVLEQMKKLGWTMITNEN